MSRPERRAAIVLCGGRSSRMGRPKAWLPWFGKTLVEHVVDQVRAAVDEVFVVTSESLDLPPLPAVVVRDREPERGPLAGLRDGLEAAEADWAFVTSTDTPFVSSDSIARLFARGRSCAPVADGYVQVLHAVYGGNGAGVARRLLDEGISRPRALLEALDFEPLEVSAAHGEPRSWQGFNTPESYLDAVRATDPLARARVELLGRAALGVEQTCFEVAVGSLSEVLAVCPGSDAFLAGDRLAKTHLASLGGRELVRDLAVPVGPGEKVSVIDALAGG